MRFILALTGCMLLAVTAAPASAADKAPSREAVKESADGTKKKRPANAPKVKGKTRMLPGHQAASNAAPKPVVKPAVVVLPKPQVTMEGTVRGPVQPTSAGVRPVATKPTLNPTTVKRTSAIRKPTIDDVKKKETPAAPTLVPEAEKKN